MYRIVSVKRWLPAAAVALVAAVLLAAGILSAVSAQGERAAQAAVGDAVYLPILMYHGVLEDSARQGQYVVSPALLEEDLRWLQTHGYETVVMQDLIDYVDDGKPLPEKPVMLTFDDGYYNNYRYAYPLLRQYGMRAVISPVVSWSEKYSEKDADHVIYSHITWEEMREMSDSGVMEIQNHSYDMHYATAGKRKGTLKQATETSAEYQAALREDLEKAQAMLTETLGKAPTTFTYPYGAICEDARPVIRELGFRATLGCESRVNRITRQPECLTELGRYLRPAGVSTAAYMEKIDAARQKAAGG